jgi:hypothetical protein
MRLESMSRFRNTIWQRANRSWPTLVLVLAAFPVATGLAAAQNAAQVTAPDVEPVLRQNLIQDPLRVAIDSAMQKGMQDVRANRAPNASVNPAATSATPIAGNAAQVPLQNAVPNSTSSMTQNGPPNATQKPSPSAAQIGPPDVNRAQNPAQPAAAPTGPIPPKIQDGITAMLSSNASLEKAGNKWGGHKQTAIKLIDQALEVCGQTVTSDSGEVKSTPADESPSMQAALTQLTAAQDDFQNAKNPWSGRRDQALALVKQALSEVQAGIDYAKSHNTY